MIWHEAIGKQTDRHGLKGMGHHPLEGGVILRLMKQAIATHAAVDAMKHHAAGGFASCSGHRTILTGRGRYVNKRTCPAILLVPLFCSRGGQTS